MAASMNQVGNAALNVAEVISSDAGRLSDEDIPVQKGTVAHDNEEISPYVEVLVSHPYIITGTHVIFIALCAFFALPYINLSDPDAGLRLRDNPYAARADAFLAATSNLHVDGFGSGTVSSAAATQSTFSERTQAADNLTLIWYTDPPTNIFTEQSIQVMQNLEDLIFESESYQNLLCRKREDGTCFPLRSPLKFLLQDSNQTLPLFDRVKQLMGHDTFFLDASFVAAEYVSTRTRVEIQIGAPLPGFDSFDDRKTAQQDRVYQILNREILPVIMEKAFSDKSNPRLTYNHRPTLGKQARATLFKDLTFAAIAVALVLVCVLFHTTSLFVASGAMLQILGSFPVSLFFYRLVLGIKLFGGLHVIGIFLILGIGVDDCFVFFDAFDQASRENPHRDQAFRMNKAYYAARYAMLTTSLTTSLCFLSMVNSAIPIIKYFGVFCAMLVSINYLLVMTMFAGILVIWDAKLRKKQQDKIQLATTTSNMTERAFITLGRRVITPRRGAIIILIGTLTIVAILASFAAKLKPSSSIDSFWLPGHPFRVYEELNADGFSGQSGPRATVRFVNGLKAPFRIGFDESVDTDFGRPVYDPNFDATSPEAQLFITEQCDAIRAQLSIAGDLFSFNNRNTCPLNDFRDWSLSKGRSFPILNSTEFKFNLLEYIYQPYQAAASAIGFRKSSNGGFEPRMIFNAFPTTRSQRADDFDHRTATWASWSRFSNSNQSIQGLGADGSSAPIDGLYEVWMETQSSLITSSYQSIAFSIGVAFVILFVATQGDFYSSFAGTFCLASSVACTLGIMYLAGWSLGAVEAVSTIILCGIAVDYSIHMSIAHSETWFDGFRRRDDRVVEALRRLGVSVMFGAMTTFLASSVLLLCTISVLVKFGQFMIIVVSVSLFLSIFLEMAFLSLPVPSKPLLVSADGRKMRCMTRRKGPKMPKVIAFRAYLALLIAVCIIVIAVGLTFDPKAQLSSSTTAPIPGAQPLRSFNFNSTTLMDMPNGVWSEIVLDNASPFVGCGSPSQPYSFFVYQAAPGANTTNSVHIEFEGRGAGVCFSKDTCRRGGFLQRVDRTRFKRINAKEESFPFLLGKLPRVQLFLPYCTADGFLGNQTVSYDGDFLKIRHLGQGNARASFEWLFSQVSASGLTEANFVIQGCGSGGIGALGTANWAAPLMRDNYGVTGEISLIVDSFTKTLKTGTIESIAYGAWGSTSSLSLVQANTTLQGRMLVASSAYDWFQASLGSFGRNLTLYKGKVESDPSVYPFLFQLQGDRHCVLLNPVNDRMATDGKLEYIARSFMGVPSVPKPQELVMSGEHLYYKCGQNSSGSCEEDADLRFT